MILITGGLGFIWTAHGQAISGRGREGRAHA